MDRVTKLQNIRRTYAQQVLATAGVNDVRIENAYATVLRVQRDIF
jgi:hypothetical protein